MKKKIHRKAVSLSAISVLSIAIAMITAVTLCVAVFVSLYSNALMRDVRVNSEQIVGQTELAVNNFFDSMKSKLMLIRDVVENTENDDELKSRLSTLTYVQNDIYAVTIYGENGEILSSIGNAAELKKHIYKDLSFDKELFDSGDEIVFSEPHVQTLFKDSYPWVITTALRMRKNVLDGAYIAVDFKFSEIAAYIDNVGVGRQGYCFIEDKNGNIVYHPQQQLLFSGLKSEKTEYIKQLPDGLTSEENVVYSIKTLSGRQWRIVGLSFTGEIAAEGERQIALSILVSFVCCVIICLVVLAVYSKIVNRPVKELIDAMKHFEKDTDNFSFNEKDEKVSEIKILSDSFGHMSVRIKELMEKVRREETELRKTELKALQAQINPHFLYNTLDSIQWMCERGETDNASKMVGALAKLFRISISRGHELITIKDEINHVKNYLVIQSFRYREQFSYSFEVDEKLETFLCNKITLQPLVENAIYHGIDRLVDEGEIKITVKEAEDDQNDILMIVEDNGVGMSEEQCQKILCKERSDSSGIGVKNVNDRLKIYFGEKYGLTVKSELDVGTVMTARIPKIAKEEQNEN
mgnify:FL=1